MNEKAKELFNGITNIDDELIESALAATPESVKTEKLTALAKKTWFKWAAAAAIFCVIIAGALVALNATGVFGTVAENDPNLGRPASNSESSGIMSSEESSDVSESNGTYSETAMRAYDRFVAVAVNEYGAYPKDYAGFSIDNVRNKLIVYLTDVSEKNLQTYRERMGESFADCVEYRKSDKSANELWIILDNAMMYLVKETDIEVRNGRPSQKGDCIEIEVIKNDKTEAEIAADLTERFGVPFKVAFNPYYSMDDVQEYAGTADIIEGFDTHVVDGEKDGVMYVIRNYKKYKLNVITREEAIQKYGNYAGFKYESQSALIIDGAIENLQARYNSDTRVKTDIGEFVKQKTETVEYKIDGKMMKFTYFKSLNRKYYADEDLDGIERNYVIDCYKSNDDCVISRYEGSSQIIGLSTANVLEAKKGISKDDAVALARRIAANSDFGVKGIDEASVDVQDYGLYSVSLTSKYGRFAASFNYAGDLLRTGWGEDASLLISQERIDAAKAKMDASIEKWKEARPGARYVVEKVTFSKVGEDIMAGFEVLYYSDPNSNACGGYIYYCLA